MEHTWCGNLYIFDIDGTLANLEHRLHFIQQEPKDWDGFFAACEEDTPIVEVIDVLAGLWKDKNNIALVSGRSNSVETATRHWLYTFKIPFDALYMRKHGDHREDAVVKAELLDALLKEWSDVPIGGVFEDRKQCVNMYRARGLRVFQVAEGNF